MQHLLHVKHFGTTVQGLVLIGYAEIKFLLALGKFLRDYMRMILVLVLILSYYRFNHIMICYAR